VRSSADGFGNIVTDERWFGIAIDQWAARMLAHAKRSLPQILGCGRMAKCYARQSSLEISLDILRGVP
jgi:hypothetical protein